MNTSGSCRRWRRRSWRVAWSPIAALAWTVSGCATDRSGVGDAGNSVAVDSAVDGSSSDAGDAGGRSRDGGEVFDAGAAPVFIEVRVTRRIAMGAPPFNPLPGAHVRVTGRDGLDVEQLSDGDGRAEFQLPSVTAPWTVTTALAGHSAISIFGVSGAAILDVPLSSLHKEPLPPLRTFSVIVSGTDVADDDAGTDLPSFAAYAPGAGTTSTQETNFDMFLWPESRASFRLLTMEVDAMSVPLRAAWTDVNLDEQSVVEVALPADAGPLETRTLTLLTPSEGPVVGRNMGSDAFGFASHQDEHGYYPITGTRLLQSAVDRFDATWRDIPANLEANWVSINLSEPAPDVRDFADAGLAAIETASILVEAELEPSTSIVVPPAVELSATGTFQEGLQVTMDAPAHTRVGASLQSVDWSVRGGWFLYAYEETRAAQLSWPELPEGVSLEDLGLGGLLDVHVFAWTPDSDAPLWSSERSLYRAVVVTHSPL